MILAGAIVALIGYGILYAGVNKLGGGSCGLRQAFSLAGCQAGPAAASAATPAPGVTLADQAAAAQQQQQTTIPKVVLK